MRVVVQIFHLLLCGGVEARLLEIKVTLINRPSGSPNPFPHHLNIIKNESTPYSACSPSSIYFLLTYSTCTYSHLSLPMFSGPSAIRIKFSYGDLINGFVIPCLPSFLPCSRHQWLNSLLAGWGCLLLIRTENLFCISGHRMNVSNKWPKVCPHL